MNGQFDNGYLNTFRKKPAIVYDTCKKTCNIQNCKCNNEINGICGLSCKTKIKLTEYLLP